MSYFNRFPKLAYDFNREGVVNSVVDIFRQVRPLQNYVDSFSAYKYTEIQDGERPDILSKRLYDTPEYYWTFFLVNDFLHDGLGSWPLSMQGLENYIKTEYNGYALETRPNIKRDTDQGITIFENCITSTTKDQNQGAFTPGTTVTLSHGGAQTAVGTLRRKDIYLNQLVIQEVTGTPISDGSGNIKESCVGQWTDPVSKAPVVVTVDIWKAWKYAEAPHHYYSAGDGNQDSSYNMNAFVSDGSTTVYNLSSIAYNPLNITVTIEGVSNYNWTVSGSTLTFASAPALNKNIRIKVPITNPDGSQQYGEEAHVSSANFFSVDDNATVAERLIQQEGSTAAPLYTSNRQYLFNKNEQRSKIRIIDPAFMTQFVTTFESLLNE